MMTGISSANQYAYVPQNLKGGILVRYSNGQIWTNIKSKKRFLIPFDWQQQRFVATKGFEKKTNCIYECLMMDMDGPMPEEEKSNLYDPETMQAIHFVSMRALTQN